MKLADLHRSDRDLLPAEASECIKFFSRITCSAAHKRAAFLPGKSCIDLWLIIAPPASPAAGSEYFWRGVPPAAQGAPMRKRARCGIPQRAPAPYLFEIEILGGILRLTGHIDPELEEGIGIGLGDDVRAVGVTAAQPRKLFHRELCRRVEGG